MKVSISSYMSPWADSDYSLRFKIDIGDECLECTTRSSSPIDMTEFANALVNLRSTSGEVLLDLSNTPEGIVGFQVKVSPGEDELAMVGVRLSSVESYDDHTVVSNDSLRVLVPISDMNEAGVGLLSLASNATYDFEFQVANNYFWR